MKYRVHHLEIKTKDAAVKLEDFLNTLRGEVISVIPFTSPTFRPMGATSIVKFFLIVEKAS